MNLSQVAAQEFLDERLKALGVGSVSRRRFAELCGRLLASGIIWREYSRPEATLYDDASVVEELLREWFDSMGFILVHDIDASLFRLYPPGEDGDDDEGVKRLRAKLSRDFGAAALALRFLYTQALTGKRQLVNQELALSLEELSQSVVSLLGTTLPGSVADRASLLRELRKHRLVRFKDTDGLGSMETIFSVLRPIMSYVSDEALNEVLHLAAARQELRRAKLGHIPEQTPNPQVGVNSPPVEGPPSDLAG
ncbi:hypothetical protein J2789_007111 [Variovorax paradoxus]|uniref:DUF4194 domain-containing protein n=1 Tax=Variovorax atrisoli TaxID=3394203 RepID=UPI00119AEB40|nr:DUF4194 domain-containing protein [Variovorax paradoxus]MDR6524400.1 hypothetical protein [Variovorax paradoxus]